MRRETVRPLHQIITTFRITLSYEDLHRAAVWCLTPLYRLNSPFITSQVCVCARVCSLCAFVHSVWRAHLLQSSGCRLT